MTQVRGTQTHDVQLGATTLCGHCGATICVQRPRTIQWRSKNVLRPICDTCFVETFSDVAIEKCDSCQIYRDYCDSLVCPTCHWITCKYCKQLHESQPNRHTWCPTCRLRHGPGTPALRGIVFPTSRPHGIMLPIKEVFRDWEHREKNP